MTTAAAPDCAVPESIDEAARFLAEHPDVTVVGGGTDVMPRVARGDLRPRRLLSLRRITDLRRCALDGGDVLIGSGVTFSELHAEPLVGHAPILAAAARAAGPAQVRNLATVGGAVVTAAPTGDLLPALLIAETDVLGAGVRGMREVPLPVFLGSDADGTATGTHRAVSAMPAPSPDSTGRPPGDERLRPGELVAALRLRRPGGPGHYLRLPGRGAGAPALLTFALALAPVSGGLIRGEVRCAAGGLTPVPTRFGTIEQWLAERIDWASQRVRVPGTHEEFGLLVADHALARGAESGWRPTDDADLGYLHGALAVLARRALRRVLP